MCGHVGTRYSGMRSPYYSLKHNNIWGGEGFESFSFFFTWVIFCFFSFHLNTNFPVSPEIEQVFSPLLFFFFFLLFINFVSINITIFDSRCVNSQKCPHRTSRCNTVISPPLFITSLVYHLPCSQTQSLNVKALKHFNYPPRFRAPPKKSYSS